MVLGISTHGVPHGVHTAPDRQTIASLGVSEHPVSMDPSEADVFFFGALNLWNNGISTAKIWICSWDFIQEMLESVAQNWLKSWMSINMTWSSKSDINHVGLNQEISDFTTKSWEPLWLFDVWECNIYVYLLYNYVQVGSMCDTWLSYLTCSNSFVISIKEYPCEKWLGF